MSEQDCPTCGPTTVEQHPRQPVTRCGNCKEWLTSVPPDPTAGEPNIVQRIVNAWDCCGTCSGGVLARHMAEERERIAQAIEAERDLDPRTPFGLGLASAAQIAREAR